MKVWSKPNAIVSVIAVLVISLLCQSGMVSNPGLPYLMEEYMGSVPPSTLTMIATLPSLAMIICSLCYPILRRFMQVRAIMVFAGILLVVFGTAPIWTEDFMLLLVERFLFGIGVGFTWPAVQSTIIELYEGHKRDTLLGLNSVLTTGGGIIWVNMAGPLALNGWRASYYAYFLAVVFLVFIWIFLPRTQKLSKKAEAESDMKEIPPADFKFGTFWAYALIIVSFVFNLSSATFFTNSAMKVVNDALGTSIEAGLAITAWDLGSIIVGLAFGFIMRAKIMNKYSVAIGWILAGIGILICANASSFVMMLVGGVIGGIGCGIFVPSQVGVLGKLAGTKRASTYIGAALAVGGLAQFFGPPLLTAIATSQHLDAGGPTLAMGGTVMLVSGIIVLVCFIIAYALNAKKQQTGGSTSADSKNE